MTRLRQKLFLLAIVGMLHTSQAATLRAASFGTTADDLPHRDPTMHWHAGFDPRYAFVFSHNELVIHASCHRVFAQLTDVTQWPTWFILVKDAHLDHANEPLQRGSVVHMTLFGSSISSTIDEFVPDSRLGWLPQGQDEAEPHHDHTWHLLPAPGGCRVITEETGIGPDDRQRAREGYNTMHHAHDLWLASLRWASEQ